MYKSEKCLTCGKHFKREYPAQKYHRGECSDKARRQSVIKYRSKKAANK